MHRSPHPSAGTTSANGGNSDPGLSNAAELSACLLSWWQAYGRRDPLQKPWMFKPAGGWPEADHPLDPYGIWIAEVMLQQTQLAVALPYWERWMAMFPTLEALAAASLDQVRLQWQGLGYYSRARRLYEAAQLLVNSPWPHALEGWMALPGIGRTTAGSILSSAFNAPTPILDGNVKRVLARLTAHPRPPARDDAQFWRWSEALLDPLRPRDVNQALMDLGATLCTPRSPSCHRCPWQTHCAASLPMTPAAGP